MIAASLASLVLAGQDPSAVPVDCSKAANTLQINTCVGEELAREEARLEIYLRQAREVARTRDEEDRAYGGPSAQRGYLDGAQAAWIAYVDIVCGGVFDQFKDGSIRVAASSRCRVDLTRERTHLVWRHFLTYVDSTPPVLPEPIGPADPIG